MQADTWSISQHICGVMTLGVGFLYLEIGGGERTDILPFNLNVSRDRGNLKREAFGEFYAGYYNERTDNLACKSGCRNGELIIASRDRDKRKMTCMIADSGCTIV